MKLHRKEYRNNYRNYILSTITGSELGMALDKAFSVFGDNQKSAKEIALNTMGIVQLALVFKNADEGSPYYVEYVKKAAIDFWDQPSSERIIEFQKRVAYAVQVANADPSEVKIEDPILKEAMGELTGLTKISTFNICLSTTPEIIKIVADVYTLTATPLGIVGTVGKGLVKAGGGVMGGKVGAKGLSTLAGAVDLDTKLTQLVVALVTGVSVLVGKTGMESGESEEKRPMLTSEA